MFIKVIDLKMGEVRLALNNIQYYFESNGLIVFHLIDGTKVQTTRHKIEELDNAVRELYQTIKEIPSSK